MYPDAQQADSTPRPDAHPEAADTPDTQAKDALAYRFRHAMRAGQVSPLFHLVMRHQQESGSCHPTT